MGGAQGETRIPLFDIRIEQQADAVAEVLRSGWLSIGPRTEAFEREFAAHLGCEHMLAVSSGTAALHLACLTAGVGDSAAALAGEEPARQLAALAGLVPGLHIA